ncbi:MAG: type II secretion system protein, partial [Planctomycetota bacterium]
MKCSIYLRVKEMKAIIEKFNKRAAFTIVELLTVMSIIVILMSLLVPSLAMV